MEQVNFRMWNNRPDKAEWGPGPWQDEPDKMQWQDDATGLPCLIVRQGAGALCGYVGIPDTHRLFNFDYNHPRVYRADLECHGGLTFSGFCRPGKDPSVGICHVTDVEECGGESRERVWWFGFDHAHLYDYMPELRYQLSKIGAGYPLEPLDSERGDIYRTMPDVVRGVQNLALQLQRIGSKPWPSRALNWVAKKMLGV